MDATLDHEAEMVEVGRRAGFGQLVSFHHVVSRNTWVAWFVLAATVGVGTLPVVSVVSWFGDPDVWFVWAAMIAFFGLMTVALAASAYALFTAPPESLSLHVGGLVHRRGGDESVLAWDDLIRAQHVAKEVYVNGGLVRTVHTISLWPEQGPGFVLNDTMPGLDQVGPVVVENVAQLCAEAVLTSLAAGNPVRHEHMIVDPVGIDNAGQYFRYSDLGSVHQGAGELVLTDRKGRRVYQEKLEPGVDSDQLALVLAAQHLVQAQH